ncbi:hypothetical protein ACVMGC_001052 [Bradyrhizobium barranii subsp. barranii]|nr:hypothetical protein [Bradyrhizobium liaoningense]MBR0879650.1 hypothetical protein [Bradyrhizobium liaoningense]
MSIQIPRRAEREYLATLGIAAVYVASLPVGMAFVGISRDLHQSLISLQRRWFSAEIAFALWVKDRAAAEMIRRQVNATMLPSNSVLRLQSAIEAAAETLNVPTTPHAIVMERVAAVVQQVEAKIEQAHRNGELIWFNRAFRQWRLEARSRGRVMTYKEARARLRRAVIERGLSEQTISELLPAVFPGLERSPKIKFWIDG